MLLSGLYSLRFCADNIYQSISSIGDLRLPEVVVSYDCATLACSADCHNAVLCTADVRITVVGGCDKASVGCVEAETIFAFLSR